MPYEFKDLAKDVAQGTEKLKIDLAKLLLATQKVDKQQMKLTKTNTAALKIIVKYDKAIKLLRKDFDDLYKHTDKATKHLSLFASNKTIKGVTVLSSKIEKLNKAVGGLAKKKVVVDISMRGSKDFEKSMKAMASIPSGGSVVVAAGMSKGMDSAGKSARRAADGIDDFGDSYQRLRRATGGRSPFDDDDFDNYRDRAVKATKATDLLASQWKKGAQEAKYFGNGIGVANGIMMGAGTAAVYLSKELAATIDQFTDARMELAKYRVEMDSMESSTIGVAKGGLEQMRKALSLTRPQAAEYFKILQAGTNQLGRTPAEIQKAAKALQATFGGDQLGRLRDYVDLLKEIPTLDTDLKITASMDDETAAIFALAQSGKMEIALDFQTAGLLGGTAAKPTAETKGEVALLNAQQKTQATLETVNDTLLGYYPSWGTQFAAMVQGIDKAVGVLGGAIALASAANLFLWGIDKNTAALVIKQNIAGIAEAKNLGTPSMKQLELPFSKIPKKGQLEFGFADEASTATKAAGSAAAPAAGAAEKTVAGVGVPMLQKLAQAGKTATSKVGTFARGLSMATKLTAGVGIALEAAGIAADYLGDHLEKSGENVSGSFLKMESGFLKAGATILGFAALGTMVAGPVGTALGALAGTVVAVTTQLDDIGSGIARFGSSLQGTIKIAGKEVPRFSKGVQSAGEFIQGFGEVLQGDSSGIKNFGKGLLEAAKTVWMWTSGVGLAYQGIKALGEEAKSPERKAAEAEAAVVAKSLNGELDKVTTASKEFEKGLMDNRKELMESGLELQKQLSVTANALKSGKFALAAFQAGVARVRLDTFIKMGGTMAGFSNAIKMSTKAVSDKFKMAGKALDEMRDGIYKNTKLEGEQRKQALDDLHKRELEAVQEFVDGIDAIVEALYKTPQLIQLGLKKEMAKTRVARKAESGSAPVEELLADAAKGLALVREEGDKINEAALAGAKKRIELEKDIKDAAIDAGKKLPDMIAKMTAEQKKSLLSKGLVKETSRGFEMVEGKAGEFAKELGDIWNKSINELGKLKDEMDEGGLVDLTVQLMKIDKSASDAKNALGNLQKEQEENTKAGGKGGGQLAQDIDAAAKRATEADSAADAIGKKFEDVSSKIYDKKEYAEIVGEIEKAGGGINDFKVALRAYGRAMAESREVQAKDLDGEIKNASLVGKLVDKLPAVMRKANKGFAKMSKLQKELKPLVDVRHSTDRILSLEGEKHKALQDQQANLEKQIKVEQDSNQLADVYANVLQTKGIKDLENQRDALEESAAVAGKLGDPIEANTKVFGKQSELMLKQIEALSSTIPLQKEQISIEEGRLKNAQEEYEKYKAAGEAGDKAAEAQAKIAKDMADTVKNTLQHWQGDLAKNKAALAEISRDMPRLGELVTKGIERFNESLPGKKIAAALDLSDALFEMAQFSKDSAKYAAEARDEGIAASKARFEAEKANIEKTLAEEKRLAGLDIMDKTGANPADKARAMADLDITYNAKKRALMAVAESKHKADVVEKARKEAEIKTGLIDASQSALEAEMEVASMRGAHLSDVMSKQKEILALEEQRVDAMREEYKITLANNGNTRETQIKGLQLRAAEANLQRKGLGYQKDIMDKMLGAALGEMRTSVGARRQRGTDVGVLGVANTRVKTASGLMTGAGPGGVTPYWKRVNDRNLQLAKKGFMLDKKEEKEMTKEVKLMDTTATATQGTYLLGRDGHSLSTHDSTTEGLLASILYVAKEVAVGIIGGKKATDETGKDTRDTIEKGLKNVQSEYKKGVEKSELGESARAAEQVAVVKKVEDETSKVASESESPGERARKEGKLAEAYMKKEGVKEGDTGGGESSWEPRQFGTVNMRGFKVLGRARTHRGGKRMNKMGYDEEKGGYTMPGGGGLRGAGDIHSMRGFDPNAGLRGSRMPFKRGTTEGQAGGEAETAYDKGGVGRIADTSKLIKTLNPDLAPKKSANKDDDIAKILEKTAGVLVRNDGPHSLETHDATSVGLLTDLIAKLDKSASLSPDKTAAGPAAPESQPVQVGGQVTVHFDSKMFEDVVVNIIDRRLNSPQARKTLDNAGYVSAKG